jgi:hypothetical protein
MVNSKGCVTHCLNKVVKLLA